VQAIFSSLNKTNLNVIYYKEFIDKLESVTYDVSGLRAACKAFMKKNKLKV
jgi:hypothetical protein